MWEEITKMEKYEAIEIEIIEFDEEDIIVASGQEKNELPFVPKQGLNANGFIEPFKPFGEGK